MARRRAHPPQPPSHSGKPAGPAWPMRRPPAPSPPPPQDQFGDLTAASLYCPICRTATPVRERLLLVLPDGTLYDYRCSICGTSTGTRTARG